MNLQRLRYFKAAAEYGSLRKAAEALAISQPSLSRQIQILEHEVKAPLFVRSNKRVVLTEAGQLLVNRADNILREVGEVRHEIAALSRERNTIIKIGAIQSTCDYLLPHAIKVFRAQFPNVKVAVYGNRSTEIVEKVGRGLIDIGIVAAPVCDPRVTASSLANDPFAFVASPSHQYSALSELSLAYLKGEPFINFPRGYPIREQIEQVAAEFGLSLNVVIELESIEAIKELVRQGVGVSLLPSSTLSGEKTRRELACIRLADNPIVREILAVRKADEPASRHILCLRDVIQRSLVGGSGHGALM